jgi:hypothetical protein
MVKARVVRILTHDRRNYMSLECQRQFLAIALVQLGPIASLPGELSKMRIKGVLAQKRPDHGAERPVLRLLVLSSMNAFVLIPCLKSIEAILCNRGSPKPPSPVQFCNIVIELPCNDRKGTSFVCRSRADKSLRVPCDGVC